MKLVRYNPRNTVACCNDPFESVFTAPLFRSFFYGNDDRRLRAWEPGVDIYEDNGFIVVTADLPGVRKDDISIDVDNGVLTLKGERSRENEVGDREFFTRERSFGSFHRAFTLPKDVNTQEITAEFKDGILKIAIPRNEKEQARQITIN